MCDDAQEKRGHTKESAHEVVHKTHSDGLAVTHGRWTMTGSAGDERMEMSERGTMVARRQPDGTWRIVFDNPSSHS
jgi:ketosteroid isomerase-like protein